MGDTDTEVRPGSVFARTKANGGLEVLAREIGLPSPKP
jgi:hypothetical protein